MVFPEFGVSVGVAEPRLLLPLCSLYCLKGLAEGDRCLEGLPAGEKDLGDLDTAGVIAGVEHGVTVGVGLGVATGVAKGVGLGVADGVAAGVGLGVEIGVDSRGVGHGDLTGVAQGVTAGVIDGFNVCVSAAATACISRSRDDSMISL